MARCECKWSDFIKWVIPFVTSSDDEFNGAPPAMIESYVRRVANDFAYRTGVLRQKYYSDLNCGVKDYPIDLTRDTELVSIKKVSVDECELDKCQYHVEEDILYLKWEPHCDLRDGLCVEYSYAPCTEGSCDVPDEFCTRYREAIVNGTIAHLLDMPSMDWYKEGASNEYRTRYEDAIGSAKTDVNKRRGGGKKTIFNAKTRFIT